MDPLYLMEVLVAVGEERSFAVGARRMGISAPAVTRAISALEDQLGVKLLNRTTRHVRVTDAGQIYLDNARRILANVADAEEAVSGGLAEPRGHLCVAAPVILGKQYLMPIVFDFLQSCPQITLDMRLTDQQPDLLADGIDVGIRLGTVEEPGLCCVQVGEMRTVVCASPSYLAANPPLAVPADLQHHRTISDLTGRAATEWSFVHQGGALSVRIQPRFSVSSSEAAVDAACAGMGLVKVAASQVDAQLRNGQLVAVLPGFQGKSRPIQVVYLEAREHVQRVRKLVDFLVAKLKDVPALA